MSLGKQATTVSRGQIKAVPVQDQTPATELYSSYRSRPA
jgi:hypothetical protein